MKLMKFIDELMERARPRPTEKQIRECLPLLDEIDKIIDEIEKNPNWCGDISHWNTKCIENMFNGL